MRKIRVLVVDDSVVIRKMLTEILSYEADIEVVGTAASGSIALAKIPLLYPDLVTLDVEMPGMDGLETLVQMRRGYPKLPIIMFSALTERAAVITLDALSRGASDYVTKPHGSPSLEASVQYVRSQLLGKIRVLSHVSEDMHVQERSRVEQKVVNVDSISNHLSPSIIAIGASTGGPNALSFIFQHFPPTLSIPIVIVQHMPPVFTKQFAERLSVTTRFPFHEAVDGETLLPGHAYIAPGDFHMRTVKSGQGMRIALDQNVPENFCRPSVDVLFSSVADSYGAEVLGVVLTGMGQDGLRGCEDIRKHGGQIMVQDEASSVVWGMPGFVAKAGLAQAIYPLSDIASEILKRVDKPLIRKSNKESWHVAE